MNDKVIEILIHLLGHLKEHDLDMDSLSEFSEGLVGRGYSEKEVAEAIQWFLEQIDSRTALSSEILEQSSTSVRILHDYERMNISIDVYGYLLRLKKLSVITSTHMEKILDYYMLIGPRGDEHLDVNEIVASVMFEDHM